MPFLRSEADKDKDGAVSIKEWLAQPWTYFDPIWMFRKMDTNLDGSLDTSELMKETPGWMKSGTTHIVDVFDSNNDGKLSLDEYRMTPHANMILVWQKLQVDVDSDGRLAIDEFTVDRPWFQAMRSVFFERVDRNHDGFLDLKEYDFQTTAAPVKVKATRQLYVLNVDDGGLKILKPGTVNGFSIGSPAISPDGTQIAFDALKDRFMIFVMPVEGGEPKAVSSGVQPNWSPDGRKIACSRFEPRNGSWIIDLEKDNPKFLVTGRGAQCGHRTARLSCIWDRRT